MGLTSCCFCLPLRTGALVIGILHLVSSLLMFVSSAVLLSTVDDVPRRAYTDDSNLNMVYSNSVNLARVSTIAIFCFSIFHTLFNSLLLHGVRKQVRCMVLSWLSWYGFFYSIATLAWLGFNLFLFTRVFTLDPDTRAYFVGPLVASTLGGSAGFVLAWYLYACVVAFYQSETRRDVYRLYPTAVAVEGGAQKH